jgi:Beta-lactamase enzyme family
MSGTTPRTIYESSGRRERRRRSRRLFAAALAVLVLAAAGGTAALVLYRDGGAQAGPRPAAATASPPAAAPRTTALSSVEVRRGAQTRLRYRIDGPVDNTWTATLVVLAKDGGQVNAQRLGASVPSAGVQAVTLRIDLSAGRYTYVVHLRDPSGRAEAAASAAELRVLPPLPPAFPGQKAVTKALDWAAGRTGKVGVAVVDSHGDLSGLHAHATFEGASLVKAMLLVAYLRARPAADPSLDAVATTMIEESDNTSAYTIYGVVGATGLKKVASLSGMEDFEPGAGWLDARVSAADQARFFFHLDRYVPAARRAFARGLLAGVTAMQRWGIPAAAGPAGWTTFFKGGWLGMDNRLMLEAAWLEKRRERWALAVMTDDNPDRAYGWDTQKGVAGLLFGEEPTAAYLATVLE